MPVATLDPARPPVVGARASRPTRSAPGCRAPRRRARVARVRPRSWRAGSSRAGGSTTTAARGSGLGPLPEVHTGLSRALTLVATLPQLEYPRTWAPWLRVVGPLLWEPPGERFAPPPGRGPVVLVAPSTAQDPGHAHAARRARRPGARARPRDRHLQRPRARSAGRGAGQRGARPVALLRAHHARLRPRRHARRARDARARAFVRLPSRRLPRGRRHGRERRARGLGRGRASGSRAGCSGRARCGWRSIARCATGRCARGRTEIAAWMARHDGARPRCARSRLGPPARTG